jgi:hypothetical protein
MRNVLQLSTRNRKRHQLIVAVFKKQSQKMQRFGVSTNRLVQYQLCEGSTTIGQAGTSISMEYFVSRSAMWCVEWLIEPTQEHRDVDTFGKLRIVHIHRSEDRPPLFNAPIPGVLSMLRRLLLASEAHPIQRRRACERGTACAPSSGITDGMSCCNLRGGM